MKKSAIKNLFLVLPIAIFFPVTVSANIVWPSLYILEGLMSWYIILAGLVIEILFIKTIVKAKWGKTILMAVSMNIVSALVGLFIIPFSGLLAEFAMAPFDNTTFATSHWIVSYILAVLSNVVIEGLFLKWVFKLSFKKNFKWLLIANALSVVLAIFVLGVHMDRIR